MLNLFHEHITVFALSMITQHHDGTANSFHTKDLNLFFLLCTGSQN